MLSINYPALKDDLNSGRFIHVQVFFWGGFSTLCSGGFNFLTVFNKFLWYFVDIKTNKF